MMKRYLSAWLVGAVLLASLALRAADQTLEGTVSDNHCGAEHATPSAAAKSCVGSCIKSMDASYTLVVGDKIYDLEGKDDDLAKFAGAKAKVTGAVDGTKMTVTAVAAGS
jgi:hypothetical protein